MDCDSLIVNPRLEVIFQYFSCLLSTYHAMGLKTIQGCSLSNLVHSVQQWVLILSLKTANKSHLVVIISQVLLGSFQQGYFMQMSYNTHPHELIAMLKVNLRTNTVHVQAAKKHLVESKQKIAHKICSRSQTKSQFPVLLDSLITDSHDKST